MRQIFLDTETTGLYPTNGDRMVEIGCVEMVDRKLTGSHLHFYLNPERDSHEDALRIHGLDTHFLSDKPKFAAVADELLAYLAGAEIIIHNAPFDMGFINNELALLGRAPLHDSVSLVLDSLALAKEIFPGKRNSLDALCDRLEVDNSKRTLHGALLDAQLLADVYINLTRGQNSLMIEDGSAAENDTPVVAVDLRGMVLPLLAANAQECAEHEKVLQDLDRASKQKTIWRRQEFAENVAA